ncbi:MAG: T9SS type A sorting domain-containing protein, partial [Bacteroidales bacterium]|nr:T9SS type A sorting domain-containing protein [Bacteroidales bacterium]
QAQMLADGTDDKAQWTVTGNGTYEFENKARAAGSDPNNKWLRKNGTYGFACYATSTGDALSLYKKVEDPTAPSITVTPYTVEVNAEGGEGVLTITCTNMGDDPYLDFEFCDASGQSTQYDWISGTLKDNQINGFIQPNYGEERTAYLRVFGYSPTQEMIYSNIVSFTQLEYIAPSVAELPFDFDGGKADIEETEGLTQEGLDSDYSSSPKLKFKNTGTWVLLQFAEPASSVSYDIKGNSFSGGQFDVYISEDGNNYQNIASYTELGATQTVTHILHFMPVYYVKWVYTQKSSGNVALGNIHASANYDVYGEVTIEQINAADTHIIIHDGGLLNVTGGIGAANNDDVIIEDGGQLIFNQDMIPATVRRNITAASSWKDEVDGWYLIASPAETMETSPVAIGNYDLFAYDEETAYWWSDHGTNAGHPFSTLNRGQGYLYANAEDQVLDLAGMMHSMNESVYVDLSYACTYEDLKGFNLVGNPFTCNLGSGNMHMGNYPVTAYYASEGGTKLETYLIEEYPIKPGRGFMIQATEEYQSLSFHQATKDGDLGYRGYIRINAGNDNAYIQIGGGNTLRKMNIANTNEVYVMNDGKDFAAARVDELEGTMPVNFKAVADGSYTITVEARGIEVYNMYLVDNFTSEVIDLMLEPSYTFNATTDDNEARFTLVFDANSIEEVAENSIFAYQNGSEIIINGNGELQVFDVTGRMVLNTTINGIQAVNMPQGVYVLRMVGDNIQTQKIVVR